MPPDGPYAHRDIIDMLGIKRGTRLAFEPIAGEIDADLIHRGSDRAGGTVSATDIADVVLATVDSETDWVSVLREQRARLDTRGGIWLLSPKRGRAGYVDQRLLIEAGSEAGLVDNKMCSLSDSVSGMRFVVRKRDR